MKATVTELKAMVDRLKPVLNTTLLNELCPGSDQSRIGDPYFNGWLGMIANLNLDAMDPDVVVDIGNQQPRYRGYWVCYLTDQSKMLSAIAGVGDIQATGGWFDAKTSQDVVDAGVRSGYARLMEQIDGEVPKDGSMAAASGGREGAPRPPSRDAEGVHDDGSVREHGPVDEGASVSAEAPHDTVLGRVGKAVGHFFGVDEEKHADSSKS